MSRSRSFASLAILAAAAASTARSQDLLQCVDPDVKAGLLGSLYEPERRYTRSMPERLGNLTLPADFTLVGTAESSFASNTAFKATLAPDEALAAVEATILDGDWEIYGAGRAASVTGFVAGPTARQATYCRDNEILTVMAGRKDESTYVTLLRTMAAFPGGGRICGTGSGDGRMPALVPGAGMDLAAHLPRLEMPDDASRRPALPGIASFARTGGMSAAGRHLSTSMTVNTALDLASLERFFADQLQTQDWVFDAEWIGRSSAGSSWTASRADEAGGQRIQLTGVLSLMVLADGSYEASFQMTRVD